MVIVLNLPCELTYLQPDVDSLGHGFWICGIDDCVKDWLREEDIKYTLFDKNLGRKLYLYSPREQLEREDGKEKLADN